MDNHKVFINRPLKPKVAFDENGGLHSLEYGDCYGPIQGHSHQARHVFWGSIEERVIGLGKYRDVVVGELGFGVGVNFLTSWQKWSEAWERGVVCRNLLYVGFEGYPLSVDRLEQALSRITTHDRELVDKSKILVDIWNTKGGYHLYHLGKGVRLLLVFGLVGETLSETGLWDTLAGRELPIFDAWFLDGFAPKCNPSMYSLEVCELIAKKSTQSAVVASYSVASSLRDNLEKVGFRVHKREGFADKKHCLKAILHRPQASSIDVKDTKNNEVVIVGSGIAALSCVKVCQNWGVKTRIISNNDKTSPSNIPTALVTPGIPDVRSEVGALKLMSFAHAIRFYQEHFASAIKGRGSIHTLKGVRERQYQKRGQEKILTDYGMKFLDPLRATHESGYPIDTDAVLWEQSMNLNTKDILSSIDIDVEAQASAVRLNTDGWEIQTDQGTIKTKLLVLACGDSFESLSPYQSSIKFVYQKTQLGLIEGTAYSQRIKRILMGSVYITPSWQSEDGNYCHTVGSRSVNIKRDNQSLISQANLRQEIVNLLLRDYHWDEKGLNFLLDFTATRVKTDNRIPLSAILSEDKQDNLLYGITGLGGHGYTWSPLLAEICVSRLLGSVVPVPIALQKKLVF